MDSALNASPSAGRLSVPAPAKLNLFLHITGQRPDGYHNLQTLFQFLDFGDELHFEAREDGQMVLQGDHGGLGQENLILRAARLLQAEAASRPGATITVRKRIPIGGGLGGGSSDAATTLLALNSLWRCAAEIADLSRLGVRLGADVPVFVEGRAAWAEGIGDHLQAVEPDEPWYLVIHPGCAVNTAAIFARPELTRNTPPITIATFFRQGGGNDCEAVVRQLHPEVDRALTWLGRQTKAQMTGTGSCVFGRFASRDDASALLTALPPGWDGIVARGRNRSPAHLALYD